MGRLGEPDDIAMGCIYLTSDESSYMTGAELVIDGGYTAGSSVDAMAGAFSSERQYEEALAERRLARQEFKRLTA